MLSDYGGGVGERHPGCDGRSTSQAALQTKNVPLLPVTPTDDATGSFEGYLAVLGNLDYNGDIIDSSTFAKTLAGAKAV